MSKKKRKGKVRLPRDRSGRAIRVGDVIEWKGGTTMRVAYMTYYGNGFWDAGGEMGDTSDNLGASLVVWRGKGGAA